MKAKLENHGPFGVCALAAARHTSRVLTQMYDGYLRTAGIESAQFALLMTLDAMPGMSHSQLGQRMGMDKTTLSRNLKLLAAKGWVVAEAADDARQRKVSLSKRGQAQLLAAKPAWKQAHAELRAGMTTKEWEAMWLAMRAMTRVAGTAATR